MSAAASCAQKAVHCQLRSATCSQIWPEQMQRDQACVEHSATVRTRNAPRASDRPAACVSTEVPSTTSSVVAANTSLFFRALMRRYRGRTTSRPPAMMPLMHSTALMPASLEQQQALIVVRARLRHGSTRAEESPGAADRDDAGSVGFSADSLQHDSTTSRHNNKLPPRIGGQG